MAERQPLVGVVMGSESDWEPVMQHASDKLTALHILHENGVFSAHRTAERVREYSLSVRERGLKIVIAGAGRGAAHLPGMVKGFVPHGFPVIGVPVDERAVMSILDMPAGVPVIAMAPGRAGAINAAVVAAEMLGIHDETILAALLEHYEAMAATVGEMHERVRSL